MLKIEINEIAFVNESKEYLDVTVHAEGYITMNLETSTNFSMDEKDWKTFKREIDKIFKNFKTE
jgi:predicted nucleotidyltransferase